jgi:hypothetical protein
VALAREVIQHLSEVSVSNLSDGVNVNNLDEIKAHLRNELGKANKPITDILNKLNMSTEAQTKFLQDVQTKAENEVDDTVQTVIVKRIKDKVEVTNLSDIVIPSDVTVSNLAELLPALQELSNKISALKLDVNVEAPNVTVNPTAVNIPETIVNVPAVDLEPIIYALKKLSSNDKSHPLAVRLTDGADWIKQLVKVQQETSKAVAAFAGGSNQVRLLDPNMTVINPNALSIPSSIGDGTKTVTTAGTRVQLGGNVACKKITMTALDTNTGKIYWGGATVSATSGAYIYAGQTQVIDIDNLNKVYLDSGVNGEGVNYSYVA